MNAALRSGADALLELITHIGEISNATCEERGGYDYPAIVATLEASLSANVGHADAQHREGYLRALGAVLTLFADGCTVDVPGPWCPLAETEPAYARTRQAGFAALTNGGQHGR